VVYSGFPLLLSLFDGDMLEGSVFILFSFLVGCFECRNEGGN
jgi:hypothetical protein